MSPDDYKATREAFGGGLSPPRRWMRNPQAAEYVGLGESTLDKKRVTGGGPPFVKVGAAVLYDREDLDRWLKDRKVRNTSEPVRPA